MKGSHLLTVTFLASLISCSFGQDALKKIIAVIPFEAIDIANSEADFLSRELSKGFTSVPEVYSVPYEQILNAIKDTIVIKDSTCRNRACQLAVGKSVKAEIIFSGTLYKVNSRYSSSITAIDCQTNATLWSKDYTFDGDFKDFQSKVLYAAVMESRYNLFQGAKSNGPAGVSSDNKTSKIVNEEISYENEIVEEDDDEDSDSRKALKNGIVKSFALGINGRYIIGSTGDNESEWGLETFVLFPTSKISHLRIKLSMPMSTADNFCKMDDFIKNRDFLYSIDHEWGLGGVGISFGFAYMYMDDFTIKDNNDSSYFNDYESVNMFNWVIGIRAGYPNKGFRGRVCFPMPFVVNYRDLGEQSNFLEYSAYGMFGADNVKGCIGVQGAFKRRVGEKKRITNDTHPYDYDSYDDEKVSKREFYFMGPSTKIAFLAGPHNVISIGLEWMGLFFPDPFNEDKNWTPNINIGYTFSFSPIDKVQTFDGRM